MIKQIGPTKILPKHKATCHCGSVELELTLPNGVENPRRCDCSICRRKGAIVASVSLDSIRIVKGHDVLRLYDRYLRTGSQLAREKLNELGVLTLPKEQLKQSKA